MWNDLVSSADIVLSRLVFRFAAMFWEHPIVGAMFMLGFLVLAIMLWVEVLKDEIPRPQDKFEGVEPIRLRR